VHVFVDELGQGFVQRKVEIDPVLDVVVGKNEPERRAQPAGLDQVLPNLDLDEVAEADRSERKDGDGDGQLRRKGCLCRRVIFSRPGLIHQNGRQRDHLVPNPLREHQTDEIEILGCQSGPAMFL
jgi:hypothetical protein